MPAQEAAAPTPSPHILSCRPWRSVPPTLPPPTEAAGEGMATGAVASMTKFWPWRRGPTGRRWRSTTDWVGGRVTQEAMGDEEEEGAGKRRAIKEGRRDEPCSDHKNIKRNAKVYGVVWHKRRG